MIYKTQGIGKKPTIREYYKNEELLKTRKEIEPERSPSPQ